MVQRALTSYRRKTRETSIRPRRMGLQTVYQRSIFLSASLINNRKNPQAPRAEHAGSGESELPNEWCGECQVACRDKHTCIDKSKSKEQVLKTLSWAQARRSKQGGSKVSYINPNYRSVRLVYRRSNPNKETLIYLSLIHIWRCRRSTLCRSRWSPYH